MAFAKVYSAQTVFLSGKIIDVEVDISKGLHAFSVVGLPDKAVEESRDRVSAAIKNSGYKSPKSQNQKIVISLAPADLKKEGPVFDLAVALAYLKANQVINFNSDKKVFLGELSLDGSLRSISGALPLVIEAKKRDMEEVYLPIQNVAETSLVSGIKIIPTSSLKETIAHLTGVSVISPHQEVNINSEVASTELDMGDIRGQEQAKRGLVIAAAGRHNVAMYGPPGTGKTMLAKAFAGLLPPLSFDEILEITSIHSIAGNLKESFISNPPFRSPHHTSSYISMVGGGTYPKPGEVTLAHKGVLFLDEFPEFERRVIDSLRQPLEDKIINISRAKGSASFPADFILIAALNPCPCGNLGSNKVCTCPIGSVIKYQRKISGPISDRVDLWLEVSKIDYKALGEKTSEKETDKLREKVMIARGIQEERLGPGRANSSLSARDIMEISKLNLEAKNVLDQAAKKMDISARSYHKTIKLARTIADMENREYVEVPHVLEALQYRPKDNFRT